MASANTTRPPPQNKNGENGLKQRSRDIETAKLEAMVTPEQVLSANVARRRRSATKRRSQIGGMKPRDPTPVRDAKAPILNDDDDDGQDVNEKEIKNTKNDELSMSNKVNKEIERKDSKTEKVAVEKPVDKSSKKIENGEKKEERQSRSVRDKKEKPPSEMTQAEVFALLNQVKRSMSSDRRPRKKSDEKKSIIKRSQSTPRQAPLEDQDLIESFKRAQRLSAEVGTSPPLPVDYPTSESSVPTSSDDEEIVKEERNKLQEKLKLIKKEKKEKGEVQVKQIIDTTPKIRRFRTSIKEIWLEWKAFISENEEIYNKILLLRNRCASHLFLMLIFCGIGGLIFRFTEGAFETFYKCGVKRVKRDFIETLWIGSHNLREDDWKSMARRKLRDFEEQLHEAHEAGMHSYSGQRSWSFLNAVVYCLTIVTTIGYGHISPSTTTGRAITIIYAVFGIPMFLILLADFGKLLTRVIKFLWAFVRRLYYTGSCRRMRKTETAQEVMKGVQMMYEIATFRRPSHSNIEECVVPIPPKASLGDLTITPQKSTSEASVPLRTPVHLSVDKVSTIGNETPNTPAPSNFAVDDEFNLPISVAILVLLLYIMSGALLYWFWENWSLFESFYFVFISMSTIGFGDFVPEHPMFMMCSIIYLIFGLALTSMCINVVQVKLSDSFRQASAKIGATIGLKIAEDDGSITHNPPTVEIADVHTTIQKPKDKGDK